MLALKIIFTIFLSIFTLFHGLRGLWETLLYLEIVDQNENKGFVEFVYFLMIDLFFVPGEYHKTFPVGDMLVLSINVVILMIIW